jgi:hypothetical protein
MKNKPFIHPNCPKKLAAAFHFARNAHGHGYKIRVLEHNLGVNFKYLHLLIKKGIEPNDSTPKLQEIRVKMFLPAKKRKARTVPTEKPAMPEHRAWWNTLKPKDRDEWIRSAYNAVHDL